MSNDRWPRNTKVGRSRQIATDSEIYAGFLPGLFSIVIVERLKLKGREMVGNANNIPIGKCSECGGVVSVPQAYMSVNRPPEKCERCGAVADPARGLPTVDTRPIPTIRNQG